MSRLNLDVPLWDQTTFYGRLRHFVNITDPRLVFVSADRLKSARHLIDSYKQGQEPPGTNAGHLHGAHKLVQSAFHPDSGELQNVAGRMCFNAYGGTLLCGAMMIWYRSTPAVIFWQWANQSFNALLNYTNRNANSTLKQSELGMAYVCATSAALITAIGLKKRLAKSTSGPLIQRFVPLIAVFAANCVNLPLMRQNELRNGLLVTDENGNSLGNSKLAAFKAISLVVISRNIMVAPSMMITPYVMSKLEKLNWFSRRASRLNIPVQLLLTFILFGSMVPVGCAIFPQNNNISVNLLKRFEPKQCHYLERAEIKHKYVYFNKGL